MKQFQYLEFVNTLQKVLEGKENGYCAAILQRA